jgi:hypothetical protein
VAWPALTLYKISDTYWIEGFMEEAGVDVMMNRKMPACARNQILAF